MLDQCGNCQVIIVEREILDDVDFSAANLIEFTKNGSIGCYGFLLNQLILQRCGAQHEIAKSSKGVYDTHRWAQYDR